MIKRYRIQFPTPEECKASGLKYEGLKSSTLLWLMGLAKGVELAAKAGEAKIFFSVFFAAKTCFYVDGDNVTVMNGVKEHLMQYRCKLHEVTPETPVDISD